MTLEEKKEAIKIHPLFKNLDDRTIIFIAERVKEKIYPPHTIIVHQDDPVNFVYFIHKGLIKIYFINSEGKNIPVKTSGETGYVGDLGAIDGKTIPATVETIQETHVLSLTAIEFKELVQDSPTFAINLLKSWAEKVRIINQQRENSFSLPLKDRTLHTLKALEPYFPEKKITLSHEEIALIIGANRARVTEALTELEKQKFIIQERRSITVL